MIGRPVMPILNHFNLLAPFYETFIKPKDPQEIVALAELPVSGPLLDAGGGTGRVAQFINDKAHPVVVADGSCEMLAETRKKVGLNPVCSHTETLPFPNGVFARIIMVDALHHVYDQQQTIDELWRVLQPGGIIVIEEPDLRSFAVKLIALGEKLALMRSHFLPPPRIAGLFSYSDARVQVKTDQSNAHIVVKKRQR